MKRYLLFLFFIFSTVDSWCVKGQLIIENKDNKKTKLITEGLRVKLTDKDLKTFTGRFQILSDSQLIINKDTILSSNISQITTKPLFPRIIGFPLLIAGGTVVIVALVGGVYMYITKGGSGSGESGLIYVATGLYGLAGGVIGLIGYITTSIADKNYDRNVWTIKAIRK